MNIITKTNQNDRSSNSEIATTVINELDNAYEVQKDDFDRGLKAWKRYFPVNYGKWDEQALRQLQEEYRQPVQFDISSPKVDTLAGSLVSDLPDPTWVPVVGQKNILTESIAETYYTDKDLFNYDDVFLKVFRDGLIHSGDLAVYESTKYHVPRICLGRILYGFLVWDPYWLTDDDRDAEVTYRVAYMNAERMVRKYKSRSDELLKAIKEYKKDKSNYPSKIYEEQQKFTGQVGDEFNVIEKHYLEHIKTTRLVGRREGEQQWIPFPVHKNRAYLEAFATINQIDWTTVIEDTYEDKIAYVTTVCRELPHVELQNSVKNRIQVNGLPFHHFTARRWAGMNMGIIESIESVEDTINKRESLITELISKANGGSMLMNENLIKDPRKRASFNKNKNKPGHVEFVDLDAAKNHMLHIANNQYPSTVIDQIDRMYEKVLPLVSRVSDALSSMSDTNEPGILFERKFQVNMIANTLMNRAMRQLINNVAESYFYQWQITYADREEEVAFRDGKTNIILNQRRGELVYNDVTSVARCRIVIAENTKSAIYQMRWRSIWSEMLNSIDAQAAPPYYVLAIKNFFETIEMKDEDKEQAKILGDFMMMIARLELVSKATGFQTQAQQNTLSSMQINMQIQQLITQMNAVMQQQQVPPISHMEPAAQRAVQYPEETQVNAPGLDTNVNPQTIEAASESGSTLPAMTGTRV